MSSRNRLIGGLLLVILVVIAGTIGFMLIEDLDLLDAFYLTVITISTVGFAEPTGGFSDAGQVATVALVVLGVGTVFYSATSALEFAIEDFLGGTVQQRRQQRRVNRMNDHVIVCGYGRIGRQVGKHLETEKDIVIVERDETRAGLARDTGFSVIIGDATDDQVLEDAGIDRAEVLIASVATDPDNVAIVLSARARRPQLRIIARASDPQTEPKLMLAGADRVVSPASVGAARMAAMAELSDIADFVDLRLHGDLVELQVEECALVSASKLVGQTLATSGIRENSGATVVALVTPHGETVVNPAPETMMRPGQTLVAIGTEAQVSRFRDLTN